MAGAISKKDPPPAMPAALAMQADREDSDEMVEISIDKPQFNTLRCPIGIKRGKPWEQRKHVIYIALRLDRARRSCTLKEGKRSMLAEHLNPWRSV
jgi:hypothetical protein